MIKSLGNKKFGSKERRGHSEMKKNPFIFFSFLLFLVLSFVGISQVGGNAQVQAQCFPSASRLTDISLPPPDYGTFKPPALGGSYCDPTFGTEVKRLTDSQNGYVTNSEIAYFNLDDSYFIATDGNTTYLFDGRDGRKIKALGVGSIRPWWIRWPRADYYTAGGLKKTFDPRQHFYKYEGNEVRLYSVDTLSYVVLHKFEEYSDIGPAGGEGDVSQDGRYWVLDGKRKSDGQLELFVYDLLDDKKGPVSPFEVGSVGGKGYGADFATISPSGKYIVIAWDAGLTDPYNGHHGVEVFNRETWKFAARVHPSRIHIELGFDAFGEEVVFSAAGNSPEEIATFGVPGLALGDQISVRMRDGFARKLLDIPSWAHFTLSYSPGQPNYIFLGYEDRSDSPESLWKPYWGEILAVATDGSGKTLRLVHHRTRQVGSQSHKAYQPDFFVSNKGDKIVFNSTYGIGGADLYMFDTGLTGTVEPPPPPPPPPANHAPVAYGGSVTTTEGRAVSGQLSASDADGDSLTYAIVAQGSLGKVVLSDEKKGTYTYAPNPSSKGTDSFTFKANDGQADSNTATLVVKIEASTPPPPPPPPPPDASLPPADYSTFQPPAAGQSYLDPIFGTAVKRLTDSGKVDLTTSEISYFSIDDAAFIAREDNATRLFNGRDGGKMGALGSKTILPYSLRWARGNYYTASQEKKIFNPAKHIFNIEGNEVRLYNVDTLEYVIIHKFPEYSKIGPAGGRGDLSQNGRYWVLDGTKPDGKQVLFVYDIFKDLKGKESPFDVGTVGSGRYAGVHFATVSPSWKYVVVTWNTGSSNSFNGHYGVEVFDTFTWKLIWRVHPTWTQFELGYDASGKEVFFAAAGNTADDLQSFQIPGLALGDLIAVELDTGMGRRLLGFPSRAPFSLAYASGQPKYLFLSVDARSDNPEKLWAPYWGEILAVPTDGSGKVIRLVHHRSRKVGSYSSWPHILVNNKGTKIVFLSTFGIGGADLYMIDFNP
jgi:hypothetical protein